VSRGAPFGKNCPHDVGKLFRCRQFPLQFRRQFRLELIDGHADGIALGTQGVFDFHVVLFRAEDDADGGLVIRGAFLVVEQIEVEIHFPREFRLERPDLYPVR
jgi:hypothetical protein